MPKKRIFKLGAPTRLSQFNMFYTMANTHILYAPVWVSLCLLSLIGRPTQAQTIDCNQLVHIYAATTQATANNPSNDASSLFTYKSTDSYAQTTLAAGMTYPADFPVQALRGLKIQLNGLAFNPKDGYLYGFDVIHSNRLLKIDKDGKALGVVTIQPQGGGAANTFPTNSLTNYQTFTNKVGGACFAPNGTLYVATSTQSVTAANELSATGSSTIWRISGLATESNTDNYSTKVITDELADGGFGDLLVNFKNRNELYVATVGRYGANNGIVKGVKSYLVTTSPWTDQGMVMVSSESFNRNYAILGLSYNEKGDFVGLTNTQNSNRLLFTMDECGNIIEYKNIPSTPYTGDGTSIFPF